jgi:hypothetical protein
MTAFSINPPFVDGGERPELAVSRRSGHELHPWLPNGDLRP